jgi:hypothetical protein
MKYLKFGVIILALCLFSCTEKNKHEILTTKKDTISRAGSSKTSSDKDNKNKGDKEEIQNLIREMLSWSSSKNNSDILPVLTDSKDSMYIGFDLTKLKVNLDKLKTTNFFSSDFIENYNQIILTLDKKIRNKEFDKWSTGELPPFSFANDVDPWCLCQDVPYDTPNPWSLVEVEVINLNDEKGELNWKWGKPELNGSTDWKDFRYKFKVKKENGKWKISYLQGFDFKESIRSG